MSSLISKHVGTKAMLDPASPYNKRANREKSFRPIVNMLPLTDDFYLLPSNSLVRLKLQKDGTLQLDEECFNLEAATSLLTKTNSFKLKGFAKKEKKIEPLEFHLTHGQPNIVQKWHKELSRFGCKTPDKRPILIFVNPQSGKKNSLKVFNELVQPMLNDFGINHELIVTKRPKEAEDYITKSQDNLNDKYSSILIISGDGLLFEVLQGLFNRPNFQAKSLPIGIIPTGSGNGLARSLAHFNNEDFSLLSSSLSIVKAEKRPMDIMKVTTAKGETLYSFLSIGYAFTSDIDIESECLRFLGGARFMIYSVKILLELRSYPAKISYLDSKTSQITTIQDDFVIVYCIKQPYVTSDFYIAPQAQLDDGYLWLLLLRRKNVNRFKLLKIMLGFHTGHHLDVEGVEMIRTKYFKFEPLCQRSYLTVDGELIDLCTVEAEVVPKAIDVFCNNTK